MQGPIRPALGLVGLLVACAQPINIAQQDTGPSLDAAQDLGLQDLGAQDLGDLDLGDRDLGAGPDPACVVDPFVSCEDPQEQLAPANEWSSARPFHETSVGCQQGDMLEGLDQVEASILCPAEPADFYRLTVVGCDTRAIIAEIRLVPLTECSAALYRLVVLHGGRLLECGDAQFQMDCRREGEVQVVLLRMPPSRTLYSWQFGIASDLSTLRLDYELRFVVR